MAVSRKQKEELVDKVTAQIAESKAMVFVDFRGLSVEQMTELRSDLRSKGISVKVLKQKLLGIAAKNAGAEIDEISLKNHPLAIAFGQDEVEPAKAIYAFTKKFESMQMVGGALNGKMISMEELKALASMPSREEMYAKIVGSLASPLRGIVGVLGGNLRGLVSVLNQVAESKK
jgi:large subunit ribosomal protein L10